MPLPFFRRAVALAVGTLMCLVFFCEAATIPGGIQHLQANALHSDVTLIFGGVLIDNLGLTGKNKHVSNRVTNDDQNEASTSSLPSRMTTSKADEHLMDSYMRTSDEDFKPQCNWPKGSLSGISMCIDALSRVPDQVWQARVPVDICVIRGEDVYITIRGSAWIGAPGGAHATSLEIITALEWISDQCTSCEGLDCYAGGAKAVGKNNKFIVKVNGRNRKDGTTGEKRDESAHNTSKANNSNETPSKRSSDEWDSCSWPRGPVKALVNKCIADQRRNPNRLYQTLDFIEICRVEGTEMDAEGRVETLQINGFVKEGAAWAEASGTDILEALDWMRDRCSTCRAARDDCYVGGFKAVGPKDDFIVQVVGGKKEDRLAARDAGEKSTTATRELARYIPDEELINIGAKKAQADVCTWPRGPMTSVLECMDQMKVDPEKVFKTSDWVRICRIQGSQDRHMLSIYGYARDGHAEGEATAEEVYQTLRWAKRYCTSCHEPHKNCYVGGWWLTGKKKNMVVQITGSAPHKDARSLFLDAGEDANLRSLSPASPAIEAVPFHEIPAKDSAGEEQDDTPASLNKPIIYKYNDLTSNTTQYLFGPNREPLEATTDLTWSDVQQAASALTPTSHVAYNAQLLSADALNPSPECHANQVPTKGTYAQACLDFLWANRDNTWDMPKKTEVDICAVQVQTVRAGKDGQGEAWKDVFRMYATTCACQKGLKLQAGAAAAGLQRLMDTCSQCNDGGMCQVGATLQFEGNLELKLHVVSYSEKVEEPAASGA